MLPTRFPAPPDAWLPESARLRLRRISHAAGAGPPPAAPGRSPSSPHVANSLLTPDARARARPLALRGGATPLRPIGVHKCAVRERCQAFVPELPELILPISTQSIR